MNTDLQEKLMVAREQWETHVGVGDLHHCQIKPCDLRKQLFAAYMEALTAVWEADKKHPPLE
jgi:hypothetical protein